MNAGQLVRNLIPQTEDCIKEAYPVQSSLLDDYKRELARAETKAQSLREVINFLETNPKFEEFFKLAAKLR